MISPVYAQKVTWDIATGVMLDVEEMPWIGGWAECKKGRESAAAATDAAMQNSAKNAVKQDEQYGLENQGIGQLTTVGANGLGMGAAGQLANNLSQIGRTYANARTNAARQAAQRGFGTAPEGAFQSSINGANVGQAMDENAAYNNAQLLTRENMLAGLGLRAGLQNTYDPTRPLGTAISGAEAQNQGGSLLGDIGSGISTGIGLVSGAKGLRKG